MGLHKFLWFSALLLSACSSGQNKTSISEPSKQDTPKHTFRYHMVIDTSFRSPSRDIDPFLKELLNKKQSTKNGNYFIVTASSFSDTTGKIIWGNDTLKRIYPEPFYLSLIDRLRVKWGNQNNIILEYGVGSGAWENIVLPLNKQEKAQRFDNALCFDEKNDLLVIQGQTGNSNMSGLNDAILIVKNLNTHHEQFIIEKKKHCESANYLYCIDSISIHDKLLYYKWVTPNFRDENKKNIERRIRITI